MRRRPPGWVDMTEADRDRLQEFVRDGHTEQRVARRARILLAMADSSTVVEELAYRLGQSRQTIWNLCRRYEQVGIGALSDAKRAGRPRQLSPPAAGGDRATRVL